MISSIFKIFCKKIKISISLQKNNSKYKMIHTFSPNWYKPQCLFFHQNYLYYASNYLLYRYNLDLRKVQLDKCFRKIAMTNNMNTKDIKIFTINKLAQQCLIIGTNQPHLVILSIKDFQVLGIIRNIGIQQSCFCSTSYNQQQKTSQVLSIDQNGSIVHITITNPTTHKIKLLPCQQLQKIKPKQLLALKNINMLVHNRGQIRLFTKYFQQIKLTQQFKIYLDQQYILSLDTYQQKSTSLIYLLTKSKLDNLYIHCLQFNIQYKGNQIIEPLSLKSLFKKQFIIKYPKSFNQKLKNSQKAALVLKCINKQYLLLTGKLGQIFIFHIAKCPESITIKPHSIQNIPPYLQILNDSKHYKEIYAVYIHQRSKQKQPQLYTISTDQTLNIWNITQNTITPVYCIKFVTAELLSIFYNQSDPQTAYFLLKDSIIRSAVPLGNQNYFLNQYWKYTKKFKIVKAVAHLQQPGITAMVTTQNKILIYDLFDDRLLKIIDLKSSNISQQIVNITFEYNTILQPIKFLTNEIQNTKQIQWKQQKLKITKFPTKQHKPLNKIGLLIQQKNTLLYIQQIKQNQHQILSIKKSSRLQRIHFTKLWNGHSLLMTQSKNNNLKIWLFWKNHILKLDTVIKLGGRCIFKIQSTLLRVLQYKAKKACIYDFSLQTNLNLIKTHQIDLPFNAQKSVINYHGNQAVFYNTKDDQIILLSFDKNQLKISSYQLGNKIQNLSFYLSNYLIIGFKNQSIKLFSIHQLFLLNDQPHKKVKKSNYSNNSNVNFQSIQILNSQLQ